MQVIVTALTALCDPFGCEAIATVGNSAWNGLPTDLNTKPPLRSMPSRGMAT